MKATYQQMRRAGYPAAQALRSAKIVSQFANLEADGAVRLRAEPEMESYFDVYGEPDGYVDRNGRRVSAKQGREEIWRSIERDGCWCVIAEWFDGHEWQHADSVGMCVGYRDPLSPVENCYVPDLMASAIEAFQTHNMCNNPKHNDSHCKCDWSTEEHEAHEQALRDMAQWNHENNVDEYHTPRVWESLAKEARANGDERRAAECEEAANRAQMSEQFN